MLRKSGLIVKEMTLEEIEETRLGFQAYFPVTFDGWGWALLAGGAVLLLWYALVRYNESTENLLCSK